MESRELVTFKWILILELAFGSAYVSITRGSFVIFLVSKGYGIEGISFVMLISTGITILIGIIINKYPSFIVNKVKTKLIAFHGLERIMWLFIPLLSEPSYVLVLFLIYRMTKFKIVIFSKNVEFQ